jgi:hypothetical protein
MPRRRPWSGATLVTLAVLGACAAPASHARGRPSTTPRTAPTLGQPVGIFARGEGFGQVEPATIFNGGDPTGLVRQSWGGTTAVGSGVSDYVGPDQIVAAGTEEPATVVAFDLGTCDGRPMYRAVEWYYPQHGQSFDPHHYQDICTGTDVPSP